MSDDDDQWIDRDEAIEIIMQETGCDREFAELMLLAYAREFDGDQTAVRRKNQ